MIIIRTEYLLGKLGRKDTSASDLIYLLRAERWRYEHDASRCQAGKIQPEENMRIKYEWILKKQVNSQSSLLSDKRGILLAWLVQNRVLSPVESL